MQIKYLEDSIMVQHTPPLGWNSWNTFGEKIDEKLIFEMADAIVNSGLLAAGYNYLVIDDSWQEKHRNSKHQLVPNAEKFPNGIKAVADYVHSKGLKFGIYSCVGNMTCEQYPGSYEYEFIDAKTFAEWEVDFLKYDYCFKPSTDSGEILYRRMGTALATCGRDILFSACSWGVDDTYKWIKTTGAHMWRSTVDIFDIWESVRNLAPQQRSLQPYTSCGCFNDMDMLIVGMNGEGNCGLKGCSFLQYRIHYSLWAILGSPLFIGCDVRDMDKETQTILMNPDILAINQDKAQWQPFIVGGCENNASGGSEDCFIWAKLLENGDYAIGLFNFSGHNSNLYFCMAELGLNRSCKKKLMMKDLWTGETVETIDEHYVTTIMAFDCQIFRAKVVDISDIL
jgi:alpha-galactosidase